MRKFIVEDVHAECQLPVGSPGGPLGCGFALSTQSDQIEW